MIAFFLAGSLIASLVSGNAMPVVCVVVALGILVSIFGNSSGRG